MSTPSQLALPKRSFLALAAIGWVDGSLQRSEADGLVRAAKACGVGGADLAEVERATKEVLSFDGVQSTDERETLARLGDSMGLDKALRVRASAAANDIACLPAGGRPDRFDFVKLGERLRERLPQLAKGDDR